MSNTGLNVMEMAQAYADNNNMDVSNLFKKPSQDIVKPKEPEKQVVTEDKIKEEKKEEIWRPDDDLIADMPEMNSDPLSYDINEIRQEEYESLMNIADDNAMESAVQQMDEMHRIGANITIAKKRAGLDKLKIPKGVLDDGKSYHLNIINAASDDNFKKAQEALSEIFEDIKKNHPDFILRDDQITADGEIIDIPNDETNNTSNSDTDDNEGSVKVVIDKRNVSQVSWTPEEIQKVRSARKVELDIVESKTIDYTTIENVPDNMVDIILSPYVRKSNDIDSALPASKYRATFSGLSYPELMDLSTSQDMNSIDGEKKKWSICFNHIHNQSIGPWEEYVLYIDPKDNIERRVENLTDVPEDIPDDNIHQASKFEDFMRKTSFIDLEFMLWKILCATAMEKEIITIDCNHMIDNVKCGNSYDWVYAPNDLLDLSSIQTVILEEMEKTMKIANSDEIMENYQSSMLKTNNVITLHCGIKVVFGHVSAYEYLENIYKEINDIDESDETNPEIISKIESLRMLPIIKGFIVENPTMNGKPVFIKGVKNILKTIHKMNEIDFQILVQIREMMLTPYQFRYSIRDLVCPKCKKKSIVPITNMSRMLFIVAQSLSNVEVILKRN